MTGRWLAELLHPQTTAPQFRSLFQETYRAVYRYALSNSEIDDAIYMSANEKSAGYERFSTAPMIDQSQ